MFSSIPARVIALRLARRRMNVYVVGIAICAPLLGHAGWFGSSKGASSGHEGITLATWNLEWLMTPKTHAELAPRCAYRQPASADRAFPCTPGKPQPPERTQADFDAMARTAAQLHDDQHADVVALQEVDGPEAAKLVFQKGWKLDCFVNRAHPQKVGFAIRDGVPYRCNGDLSALDVDGSTRAGADITLYPGTEREVRLLAVHLKSGCFDGKMDRHFGPCERLRQQAPIVESWIDQRVRAGTAFAVLGDFNRHLDKDARYPAGPDESAPINLMQAWSDNEPAGAVLLRASEGQAYVPCDIRDKHKAYIDDILIDQKLAARGQNKRFVRLPFAFDDRDKQLSDHCPVVFSLEPIKR